MNTYDKINKFSNLKDQQIYTSETTTPNFLKLAEEIRHDINLLESNSTNSENFKKQIQIIKNKINLFGSEQVEQKYVIIKSNMIALFDKKLNEKLKLFNNEQTRQIQNITNEKIRIIKIYNPDISNENMYKALEHFEDFKKIQIMHDNVSDLELSRQLDIVKKKYEEVSILEKNITELHNLLLDLANLVVTQGEYLNDIESNILHTNDHIDESIEHLQISNIYQKNIIKQKCCIVIIFISILVIILIIIMFIIYLN